MNLGAHMSIAGGVHRALERGLSAGCNVVQIFTKNQTRWSSPPLKDEDVEKFLKLKLKFFSVFAHASYLINLASPDNELYLKSVNNLTEELRRCQALGINMIILHPGFHKGSGEKEGIRRIARGIKDVYNHAVLDDVEILLETTSGQGTALGSRFEHLRDIIADLPDDYKIGACLDTCHIFSAGYDIRDESSYSRTWIEFDLKIGLSRLKAIHLNDSKKDLGSARDRHEHIGKGKIGLSGFRLLVTDARFRLVPMSLETPKGPDLKEDRINLSVLRSLRFGNH